MAEDEIQVAKEDESQGGANKLVPVAESIKYRRRAQQAESDLQALEQKLAESQALVEERNEHLATADAERDEAKHQLTVTENRLAAERLLSEAGVVDLDAASLLLTKRLDLSQELDSSSLLSSIEQLLLDKPFLIHGGKASLPPKTASAHRAESGLTAQLARAAEQAMRTGDRRQVGEYLRLRRQVAGASERATSH